MNSVGDELPPLIWRTALTPPRILFTAAPALMMVDAVAFTLGAIAPIQRALGPTDPYWKRRLTLNLLLANQGLYFAGIAALVGSFYAISQPQAAIAIEFICFLTCAYTAIAVPLLTPKDWRHILPRAIAGALILTGLAIR